MRITKILSTRRRGDRFDIHDPGAARQRHDDDRAGGHRQLPRRTTVRWKKCGPSVGATGFIAMVVCIGAPAATVTPNRYYRRYSPPRRYYQPRPYRYYR